MSDSERNWFSGRIQLSLTSPQSSELLIIAATEMKGISGARKISASEILFLYGTDRILSLSLDSVTNYAHVVYKHGLSLPLHSSLSFGLDFFALVKF